MLVDLAKFYAPTNQLATDVLKTEAKTSLTLASLGQSHRRHGPATNDINAGKNFCNTSRFQYKYLGSLQRYLEYRYPPDT